jgi:hypothetical protein
LLDGSRESLGNLPLLIDLQSSPREQETDEQRHTAHHGADGL